MTKGGRQKERWIEMEEAPLLFAGSICWEKSKSNGRINELKITKQTTKNERISKEEGERN